MEEILLPILLKMTIAGSVLVVVVLGIRFALRSLLPKSFTVWLWAVVFAAFILPVTLPVSPFLAGVYPGVRTYASVGTQSQNTQPRPNDKQQVSQDSQVSKNVVQSNKAPVSDNTAKTVDPYRIALIVWASVSAVLMVAAAVLYGATMRRFRALVLVPEEAWLKKLRGKVGVHRRVELGISGKTAVPVTAGIIRAKIVMPRDFDFGDKNLTEHICTHELIHIRRNDNAVTLIALFIVLLHWFNPFVWVAYYMLCRDIELSCDARTVKMLGYQSRADYAQSLLSIAGKKRKIQPMFLTAFGKQDIKERVVNVMRTRKISAGICSLCVVCAVIVGALFTMISCTGPGKNTSSAGPSVAALSYRPAGQTNAAAAHVVSSENNLSEKNLMNPENVKKFNQYAQDYYGCFDVDYSVSEQGGPKELRFAQEYSGSISQKNGDGMICYAILNNQSGVDLKKYYHEGSAQQQWYYELPQAVGDKILSSCFDLRSPIDHSKIDFYNTQKKAYIVPGEAFYQDIGSNRVVRSIKQTGSTVVSVVDYCDVYDKSKKLQTMRFTFKVTDGKYVYEKAESL